MRETLCKLLCCPDCGSDLGLDPDDQDDGEILSGTLTWVNGAPGGDALLERGGQ